jgi:hypothetical protein
MFVILLMAGIAVLRSSQKDPVDVAGLARDFLVLSLQLEDRQLVIESGGCPAGFGMAVGTVQTQSSLMRVILLVARIAILLGGWEIAQCARIVMALVTGKSHMPALELEGESIVVKVIPKTVHAIMTVQAGCPVCQAMSGHKGEIRLAMAGIAGIEIEPGDILSVAVLAGKRPTRRREAVTV